MSVLQNQVNTIIDVSYQLVDLNKGKPMPINNAIQEKMRAKIEEQKAEEHL